MWPSNIDLAGRQKDVDADVDQQTAFDFANDLTGHNIIFAVRRDDLVPLANPVGFSFRQEEQAVLIFEFLK